MNTIYYRKKQWSVVSVIAVLVVIALAALGWQQRRLSQYQQRMESLQMEIRQLPGMREELARLKRLEVDQAEVARLRQMEISGQSEVVKLRAKVAAAKRAEVEADQRRAEVERQAAAQPEQTNTIGVSMAEVMKGSLEQLFQRRMSRMQEKLNLSPEQAQAIQAILTRQSRGIAEATRGIYTGKMDRQKMAELRGTGGNAEERIRALLSPEQQAAYTAMKEEDNVNNSRLAANSELLQMQNTLALTADQQDKVYAVLYEQILQQGKEESAGNTYANPAEAMQAMHRRRLQALEGLLTSSQLEGYRQQQERQLSFMSKIVTQMDSAARP